MKFTATKQSLNNGVTKYCITIYGDRHGECGVPDSRSGYSFESFEDALNDNEWRGEYEITGVEDIEDL